MTDNFIDLTLDVGQTVELELATPEAPQILEVELTTVNAPIELEAGQTVELELATLANAIELEVSTESPPGPSGATGPSGPAGPQGPAGPAGDSALASSYIHIQNTPISVWVIDHPLPFVPNVVIIDSAGTVITTMITYVSPTRILSTSTAPFAGKAYLS